MTKFVEAIEPYWNGRVLITNGKIYEVIKETGGLYCIRDDSNNIGWYSPHRFVEVEAPTKEETNTFKFIPETDLTYATVNGIKGILIKE